MSIKNNYGYKGQQYLNLKLSSDDELEKYKKKIIIARDTIPRAISFHSSDDTDINSNDRPCVLLEPNWIHFQDWVKGLDRHSFWTLKTRQHKFFTNKIPTPHYISGKVRAVLGDIIHGLLKSHKGGFYSGLLTVSNIKDDATGIFVSDEGDAAIVVCYNRFRERLPAWGASTASSTSSILFDPNDEFLRRQQDLMGFKLLVDYLVHQFKDNAIQISTEIEMFDKLYTYGPNFKTPFEIEKFEIYVSRAPLFWNKYQLSKFCRFMHVVYNKEFKGAIDYSKLRGWQNEIIQRGQSDRLNHIYGNNTASYSSGIEKIIVFIRNAVVHLYPASARAAFGYQEAVEIIHEQYPHWLPILYTSLIGALGAGSKRSKKEPYRTFHELFMEEFDS